MRAVLGTALAVAALAGPAAGQSLAAEPWWHLNTVSSPPMKAGEASVVIVEASNLGDAYVNGFEQPYTVTDTLPAGVTPVTAHLEGGGEALAGYVPYFSHCALSGQTATCTAQLPLLAYERVEMVLAVDVAPQGGSGMNEASVSGGGASTVVSHRALALESRPLYGAEHYELTPEEEGGAPDTQAGSHPFQLTTTLTFNTDNIDRGFSPFIGEDQLYVQPVALTKDLRFALPPGLIGNPAPLAKCSIQVFLAAKGSLPACPNDTVIGAATPIIANLGLSGLRIPWAFDVPLYNLEPAIGEPARFGFPTPAGGVILDTSVRTGGDYGVIVTVPDILSDTAFVGTQVTFWGVPADPRHDTTRGTCLSVFASFTEWETHCPLSGKPQPFLIMPTSCTGPLHTTVEGDSWEQIGQFTRPTEYVFPRNGAGEALGLDGCNHLSFEPSVSLTPDGRQGSTPTGLTVGVHVPQNSSLNPRGLADSTVRDTRVTLPAGVVLNPAGADGLESCSLSQVGLEVDAEQACPEAAKVATVEIETPLLPHKLEGAAYIAQQNANPFGSLLALYLVVKDPYSGVIVKLSGEVKADPVTGQLTSTFDETPQLPFENLRLNFFGGSRAPLATPPLCGDYTTTASIAPWSGNPAVDSSSTFEVDSGPNRTPCQNPLPFAPSFHAGVANIQSAEFTPFTMTMSREDGNQNLDAITLHMPKGLYGLLTGVELCPEPRADEGLCGPNSLIGETTISVGLGGNPYTVFGGKVYITGPYKGAPFGLSIVNPAKAGPFDVGQGACDCVVVRAKIEVDPITAALTVTSDMTGPYRIPTILDGIPLEIKHINVTVNRQNFIFNPTNCEKQAITGALTSSEGATDTLAVPFQVTNCARLIFPPEFRVATSGKTSRTAGASLAAKLTYPKSGSFDKETNIAKVKVELPPQLPARLTTLQKACPDHVFEANPQDCPPGSRIGEAEARTPIIPEPFKGPAYFVSHGGAKFPELIIVLHGYSLTVDLHGETFISQSGILSTTFNTVPDVAIGSFTLNFPEGPSSVLGANVNLCSFKQRHKLVMPTTFTAQNGEVLEESTPIAVSGCPKASKAKRHRVKRHHRKHKRAKKGGRRH